MCVFPEKVRLQCFPEKVRLQFTGKGQVMMFF